MLYLWRAPGHPLSLFVASLWYAENAPAHALERLLPGGEADIVLSLSDGVLRIYDPRDLHHPRRFVGPLFSGAHSRPYVVDTLQQASLMGVQFLPGGARPFIGDSIGRFENQQVALEDLWGRPATDLQGRLLEARSHAMRFQILEAALLERLTLFAPPHPAVALAVAAFTAPARAASVGAVARSCGLSSRRFIEVFRREVGLPPKMFCRVLRFQRALQLLSRAPDPDLAGLALSCGYYDQAHLNRDFKSFAGITPTAYLASPGAHPSHVPIIEPGQIRPRPLASALAE